MVVARMVSEVVVEQGQEQQGQEQQGQAQKGSAENAVQGAGSNGSRRHRWRRRHRKGGGKKSGVGCGGRRELLRRLRGRPCRWSWRHGSRMEYVCGGMAGFRCPELKLGWRRRRHK